MAKKDRQDKTPIEFYVPGPGGRGSKIPIPINQPNWKYNNFSKGRSGALGWAATGLIIIIIIISILTLVSGVDEIPAIWIIIIALGIFLIFFS